MRKDFVRQANKMHQAVELLLRRHRDNDAIDAEPQLRAREQRHIRRLRREACELEQWLEQHREERKSAKGKPRLSNRTDNESAKMATGKGVVQGYTGVAGSMRSIRWWCMRKPMAAARSKRCCRGCWKTSLGRPSWPKNWCQSGWS